MAQKKEEMNLYLDVFRNPKSLFEDTYLAPKKIMDDCIFILDTNVLLLPYNIGNNELQEISKVYKELINQKKLFIPAHVAKEFAKNRPNKIADMHKSIHDYKSRINEFKFPKYKMLSELDDHENMLNIQSELNQLLCKYKESIKNITKYIDNLTWNDPVSKLYSEIFTQDYIIDYKWEYNIIKDELNKRHKFNIPPGYKDKSKDDGGIGDFIIWKDILETGLKENKNIIFVTGDEKSDWYHQSNNSKLFPRFELLNEFKIYTKGKDVSIISLSTLLEHYSNNQTILNTIKESEITESNTNNLDNFIFLKKFIKSHNKNSNISNIGYSSHDIKNSNYLNEDCNDIISRYTKKDDSKVNEVIKHLVNYYISENVKTCPNCYETVKDFILMNDIYYCPECGCIVDLDEQTT